MINYLVNIGVIKSEKVKEAFLRIDRKLFVPDEYREYSYCDTPLPIGYGQTISAPSVIAIALEELELSGNEKVLEIGTGSGYSTALLASLSKFVVSIERIKELAEVAKEKLRKLGITNVRIVVGNGYYGYSDYAPYDRIIFSATMKDIPNILFEQLAEGGILLAPLDYNGKQVITKFKKIGGEIVYDTIEECLFVPVLNGTVFS